MRWKDAPTTERTVLSVLDQERAFIEALGKHARPVIERHLKHFAHEASCLATLRAAGLERARVEKKLHKQLRHVLIKEWAAAAPAPPEKPPPAEDEAAKEDDLMLTDIVNSVKAIGRLGRRHSSFVDMEERAAHLAKRHWAMARTVATGAGVQAVSDAAKYAARDKDKRQAQATPRRRLLDRLVLRLLLYEDSVSSVDAPLDPPRSDEDAPTTRRVYGILAGNHVAIEGMDEVPLEESAASVVSDDGTARRTSSELSDERPEDSARRRWTTNFDGVEIHVDASTEVAYALLDVRSVDADIGFVDALVGFQTWSGWTHALVPRCSDLQLYV